MGKYSSDSEEERKKRKKKKKKRSRSRSGSLDSRHSSKVKKSKKSKKKYRSRSRSKSTDRYKRSRSTSRGRRSRSYDRYRSRSRSRDRYRKRSRSLSRGRYSRSRSRDRRRRRSRSYERSRRSRSYSPSKKDKKKRSSLERDDPCSNIPGFSDMTPADQARIRMQMALKAAAAADEKLKGDNHSKPSISLQDQLAFTNAVQDIEGAGFTASSFQRHRWEKKEDKSSKEEFTFGTAGEMNLQRKPVIINVDTDELAHPNLYADPEEKLDRWIQKLTTMRRKKLEGESLT